MTWKVVNITDAGTSIKFGADDLDKVNKGFSGIDVDDYDINSDWNFRSGKLDIRNPANTFSYNVVGAALAATRTLNLPLLTGTDTVTVNGLAQTLSNKTLDSSCTINGTLTNAAMINAANSFGDFDNSFKDNRIRIWNPADTFRTTIINGAVAADRNASIPALSADDSFTFINQAQTLTNKTIDNKDNSLGLRSFSSIIFKSGSTYYAKKYDGTTISSGSTAETVIQAALDLAGEIYISEGNYDFSAGFTGLNISITDTHLIGNFPKARLRPPNGYTGNVIKIEDMHWIGEIDGIYMETQGSTNKTWTGFKIKSTTDGGGTAGVNSFRINNCYIYKPKIGMDFETTSSTAYITYCTFSNIIIHGHKDAGIVMSEFPAGSIQGNQFNNVMMQMDSDSVYGFKDISGSANMFLNCAVDNAVTAGQVEANIVSTAQDISIIGGWMTGKNAPYYNKGSRTQVFVPFHDVGPTNWTRPDIVKSGAWFGGTPATNGDGMLNGRLTAIAVGTGTNAAGGVDSTGNYRTFDTGATINSISGIFSNALSMTRVMHAYFKTAIYLNSVSNVRVFAGLVNSNAAPASAADPLNALEGVGLWLDSGVSADWKIMHNDATGASTVDALTTPVTAATSTLYPIEIYVDKSDSEFRVKFNEDNYKTFTTNIPASTTGLAFRVYMENTTGASRTFRCFYAIIRNDK